MKQIPLPDNSTSSLLIRDDGSLFVQALDAYGYQREMIIAPCLDDIQKPAFSVHVYQHPGRREIVKVSRTVGAKLIARLLELVEKYPDTLFNAPTNHAPRCRGFVSFQEAIFRGETPSAKIL